MLLFIYRTISLILYPFLRIYIFYRIFSGKEDSKRYKEKFGVIRRTPPEGKLIWFHAASVGELNSIIPLIKRILEINPEVSILVTTTTLTSAKIFTKAFHDEKRVIHQFFPFDIPTVTRKFLKHWKPSLTIFTDSEIWFGLIHQISSPLVLLNGRISDTSFKRWLVFEKIFTDFTKSTFAKFNCILPCSEYDKEKFAKIGSVENIKYIGNIKNAAPPLPLDENSLNSLKKEIEGRQLWVAASTHRGEEEIILNVHKKLKSTFPSLLTIIVPRHPNRKQEITDLIYSNKLSISCRSLNEVIRHETDVYLADTIGELGLFYRLSDIAFIGGSIVEGVGGHNMFEAAKLGCAVISGSQTFNFKEMVNSMKQKDALLVVHNEDELYKSLKELFNNNERKRILKSNSLKFSETGSSILEQILKCMSKLWN